MATLFCSDNCKDIVLEFLQAKRNKFRQIIAATKAVSRINGCKFTTSRIDVVFLFICCSMRGANLSAGYCSGSKILFISAWDGGYNAESVPVSNSVLRHCIDSLESHGWLEMWLQ